MTQPAEPANGNTLDSFDAGRREAALRARASASARRAGTRPGNLHAHSFFSFNCHGWSPSHFAACAADHGMAVAGLVDFDVLDGLEEFHQAGQLLNLRTVVSLESRAFVPEFADRVINSPGEPGIAYHMAAGFAALPADPWAAGFLRDLRSRAERRNRDLVERVNTFLDPVRLDYDADVLPLTPAGNATERHICTAYARKAAARYGAGLLDYWTGKLGPEAAGLDLPDGPKLLNALRARTMKKGGVGYVQPGRDSFPLMADLNRFALQSGAIPMITWLDGLSAGEQAMEELIQVAMRSGAAALNIIPDRNFTPGKPDQKLKNLHAVLELAEKYHLPVIGGTELNGAGQKFVDAWDCAELAPLTPIFDRGAFILYAHTALQRAAGLGYLSPWAAGHFARVADKNAFFEEVGRRLTAATELILAKITPALAPDELLKKLPAVAGQEGRMTRTIPSRQRAVQLVGPDQLALNPDKIVHAVGDHQILGRIEVTGLCFSDLKLLKQFSGHVRKSDVLTGVDPAVLPGIPSYVPNEKPVVPGHETVVRIVKIGAKVKSVQVGDRRLVQTDYRWLKTANSNAAFGYNFEGALQEYVLMDERVITSPDGESMLLPASEGLAASAIALVEPWACVEDSYVVRERQGPKPGGKAMTIGGPGFDPASLDQVADESLDDIVFLGADAALLEKAFTKIAKSGLVNIVQNGQTFGRAVNTPVGRVHYGNVRITGTAGSNPADGYAAIPATGEIRPGDRINVVGAGGPMGSMHVIRDLCQGVPGVSVLGGDMSDERLAALAKVAAPLAKKNGVAFETYNAKTNPPAGAFGYLALMVPAPALVEAAIHQAAPRAVINIFAGIPATVWHPLTLDAYVAKQAYFIGTSGSDLNDMKIVLKKVESRALDTNLSVAAISGLDGAVDGIRAVEKQLIPGKILVYPSCRGLGLTPLTELAQKHPEVAALLDDGVWNVRAERKLIELYG